MGQAIRLRHDAAFQDVPALQEPVRAPISLKNISPNDIVDVIRQVCAGKKRVPPEVAVQLAEHMRMKG